MNKRNTKQKDIILKCIVDSYTHPTMMEIIEMVARVDSSIGQATIYRNVNKLLAEGKIVRIANIQDGIHYDGNVCWHNHFVCARCGSIMDINDNSYAKMKKIEDKYSVKVSRASIVYEGICNQCLQKN